MAQVAVGALHVGKGNCAHFMSRKLASASWSLLALASIPGAAQGHHVIFHAKGGDPPCFCFDLIPTEVHA